MPSPQIPELRASEDTDAAAHDAVEPWHAMPVDAVLAAVATDPTVGLPEAEAEDRRRRHGTNTLAAAAARPKWLRFLDQFRNVLVGILVAGAVVAALIGDMKDAIAIAAVLVLNAVIGYVQEQRAADSLASLRRMLVLVVKVRRGGRLVEVPTEELVPGDVVLLEAGDRVPADGRVIEAWSTEVDESSLTGESVPVAKVVDATVDSGAPLGDRVTAVFMNTQVTQGRLVFVVTSTGMDTEMGHVADLIAGAEDEGTPLQVQLDQLGKRLAAISGSIVAVYFGMGWLRDQSISDLLISSVALIVAAIPEGLPAVVTLTLAVGTRRLARRGAIVKRLASVETLGSTSVICSDKTGTLTVNQMTVRAIALGDTTRAVTGEGYAIEGVIDGGRTPDLVRLAEGAALCNDSHVDAGSLIGDPTEGALVVLAEKAGVHVEPLRAAWPRTAELPFDSARRFMATVHESTDGRRVLVAKGAWEAIADRCASVLDVATTRALTPGARERLDAQASAMASQGLRVLAVAQRELATEADVAELDVDGVQELTAELTLIGLVGLVDPPRPEVAAAVARCHAAGIDVKMVTGDHLETARAIAEQIGITGEAIDGAALDELDDEALSQRLAGVGVIARVSPEHKVRVVRAVQRHGDIVAMTGDGVNDAPALSAADIGVAMGGAGTEVAKDSADMVLADDNFATIVRAVEQGRGIYANIIKFVRFQVATNIGALTTFIGAQAFGLPVPFNPIQILWINLIMDGPPAMALGVDPPTPGAMERAPRDPRIPILTRPRLHQVFVSGALMCAGTLGVYAAVRSTGEDAVAATLAFTTFVMFQIANALNVRDEHDTIFRRATFQNPQLWAALVGVAILQALAVYLPIGQRLFDTTALTAAEWALAVAVASSVIWVEEARKLVRRRAARR